MCVERLRGSVLACLPLPKQVTLNSNNLERKGFIIYYDWEIGGFTLDEWLVHWSWMYFISAIDVDEYLERIDYISPELPGVLDAERWEAHTRYLRLLEPKRSRIVK